MQCIRMTLNIVYEKRNNNNKYFIILTYGTVLCADLCVFMSLQLFHNVAKLCVILVFGICDFYPSARLPSSNYSFRMLTIHLCLEYIEAPI